MGSKNPESPRLSLDDDSTAVLNDVATATATATSDAPPVLTAHLDDVEVGRRLLLPRQHQDEKTRRKRELSQVLLHAQVVLLRQDEKHKGPAGAEGGDGPRRERQRLPAILCAVLIHLIRQLPERYWDTGNSKPEEHV